MPTLRARERAEHERHPRAEQESEQDADPRVPAQVEALRIGRRRVAEGEPGDPVDRDLREREHAAVGREERQARGDDAEQQHLREKRAQPVGRDDQRGQDGEHEQPEADDALDRGEPPHAGRPKIPSGRIASTTASSTNVRTIE